MTKKIILPILTFVCIGAMAGIQAADPQPPSSVPLPSGAHSWKLILNDNFDGTAYDTSIWNPYSDWGGVGSFNSGRENYYPSQIKVNNGICNLVAQPNPGATTFANSYKSGELISARVNTNSATPYKFSFLYGYVEARLKIVNVSGFFGAFWMLPDKKNYNYEWEIDILEVLGHMPTDMFQTYSYYPGLPLDQSRNTSWEPRNCPDHCNGNAPTIDYSTAYHTFGVDWQPDHLTFYIDGIASGTFPTPGTNNVNIPRTAGYIIIQQMVENSWIRSTGHLIPDTTSSVDTFHIDYVRVWQGNSQAKVDNAPAAALEESGLFRVYRTSSGWMINVPANMGPATLYSANGHTIVSSVRQENNRIKLNADNFVNGVYFLKFKKSGYTKPVMLVQ
jgi:beta-glucanase (GH16 family)